MIQAIRHSAAKRLLDIRTQLRRQSKEVEFQELQKQLARCQYALSLCFDALHTRSTLRSDRSIGDIKQYVTEIRELLFNLRSSIEPKPQFINKHFQEPNS